MPEIKNVLVVTYLMKRENRRKLLEVLSPAHIDFCMPNETEKIADFVQHADVAILEGDASDLILSGPNLKWIHCFHAGLDKTVRPDIFERGIILTSSSGRSAPALAEHALMFMLALTYDFPEMYRAQQDRHWSGGREYFMKYGLNKTGMYKKTVGIVGLGKTGQELARLSKGFDMRVLGWRRSADKPANVDEVFSTDRGDSLEALLTRSDYVVLSAGLNDATYHIINRDTLKKMKSTAFLINIGRGSLVDEPALIEVLTNGSIAGAGLDTFEKEPLPESSPLWTLPNVLITPHTTPALPDKEERAMSYLYQNINAFRTDGHFVNRLHERDLYTKQSS
jgi:phosphoglycerate dehydrogenase-like enzyme